MATIDVIVETTNNNSLHSPGPDKKNKLIGPCERCKPLSAEEQETFDHVAKIIEDISAFSSKGNTDKENESVESLKQMFPSDGSNNYLARLCDSSEDGDCDTLLHK